MKQYCRYCSYLVTGNGIYCTMKMKELAESTTKTTNKCAVFDFCSIDAFDETKCYQPRNNQQTLSGCDTADENQLAIN